MERVQTVFYTERLPLLIVGIYFTEIAAEQYTIYLSESFDQTDVRVLFTRLGQVFFQIEVIEALLCTDEDIVLIDTMDMLEAAERFTIKLGNIQQGIGVAVV